MFPNLMMNGKKLVFKPREPFNMFLNLTDRQEWLLGARTVQRLMKQMGLSALYCRPYTSKSREEDYKYPYLLKDLEIIKTNQVWSTNITYIKMPRGFVYLCALIDIYSRFIVSWKLSIGLQADFCLEMLETAFKNHQTPEIINTDQGSQFTSFDWIKLLADNNIKISMDGKGRWPDNIYIERFCRTMKQEQIYINPPDSVKELKQQIERFIYFYNHIRPHQSLMSSPQI